MADKRTRGRQDRAESLNTRKLFVRIPPELEEALEKYAEERRWSVSGAARNLLIDALLPKKRPS